jgi:putative intracellular protease/amidase
MLKNKLVHKGPGLGTNIATSLLMLSFTLTAALADTSVPKGKVLIVVSSENRLTLKNGNTYPTGYYLNELAVPAKHLVDAGYSLVFADPLGNQPSMDERSDNLKYFGGDQSKYAEIKKFYNSLTDLQHPHSLKEVISAGLDQYVGIFIPGGHAPMIDLMASQDLGEILFYFHKEDKPTALICHGPVALVSTVKNPIAYQQALIGGNFVQAQSLATLWPYKGYRMTIFSTTEEILGESNLGGQTLFYPETALQSAGGKVEVAEQWKSEVVEDRELITGQNPFSDEDLSKLLLKALDHDKSQ